MPCTCCIICGLMEGGRAETHLLLHQGVAEHALHLLHHLWVLHHGAHLFAYVWGHLRVGQRRLQQGRVLKHRLHNLPQVRRASCCTHVDQGNA